VSYATALWAMTRAPIGLVAALRETSVIWAMLIGAVFLRETWSFGRISAALSIVAGLLVLKVG
jgi:drug/metabolite transporter (DMT)-like permease